MMHMVNIRQFLNNILVILSFSSALSFIFAHHIFLDMKKGKYIYKKRNVITMFRQRKGETKEFEV